ARASARRGRNDRPASWENDAGRRGLALRERWLASMIVENLRSQPVITAWDGGPFAVIEQTTLDRRIRSLGQGGFFSDPAPWKIAWGEVVEMVGAAGFEPAAPTPPE